MINTRNFCIIAHIDHGKSTLADRLLELTGTVEKRKMRAQYLDAMDIERERGITIKLQPVRMLYRHGEKQYQLNLIDTPGHVDFSYEVSRSLAAVEGAILLVDATKGIQAQTLANVDLALRQDLKILPVINKIDLANSKSDEVVGEVAGLLNMDESEVMRISAKSGEGVAQVLEAIVRVFPPPRQMDKSQKFGSELRALIFDSEFDTYKGVIAFVRIFSGRAETNQHIRLCASDANFEVLEVGFFNPQQKISPYLQEGEIGYIATGLKQIDNVRVGDTLINASSRDLAKQLALPDYKEPRPVVFASFFPEDSNQFHELKDALDRLKLSDASLIYEPESSSALGRGFRLGFLGMLHVEVISERLKREFNLSLIVSTPSVEYHVLKKSGDIVAVRSAGQMPPSSEIDSIEEPFISLEILSPSQYQGAIIQLMVEYRGELVTSEYLTKDTFIIKYLVPLAEIVTDFYDRLKSVTSGYASMNYEPHSYRISDLVKLDILVAGETVEPFSKIIPREHSYREGRRIIEKLKTIIPRQWFQVTLQAALGSKIIARANLSALRKDVTGHLYGGDVTRKKKLLEKQKKGKAKMKQTGRVDIPQKVFLEMLKK